MPLERQGLAQQYLDCAIEAIRRAQGAKNFDMRERQRKTAGHYLLLATACGYQPTNNSNERNANASPALASGAPTARDVEAPKSLPLRLEQRAPLNDSPPASSTLALNERH
jgi:hypothetical protein